MNLQKFARSGGEGTEAEAEGQTMFIKKSAARLAEQQALAGQEGTQDFGLPIKDMLGVISYCYVRGVFSSKEIAEKLRQEPALRKSFGRRLPDEAAIKAFRRQYASQIEEVLENSYRAFPPTESKVSAQEGAGQTEIVHREAAERLHDAFWEDVMRRHLH